MPFNQNWIDSTVHCVSVVSFSSNPEDITASEEVVFSASIKSSDTFAGSGTVELVPEDGEAAIVGVIGAAVDGVYPVTFPGHTYLSAGDEIAVLTATTDSGQIEVQKYGITVAA